MNDIEEILDMGRYRKPCGSAMIVGALTNRNLWLALAVAATTFVMFKVLVKNIERKTG